MTVLGIDDYPEWTDYSFHYMTSDNRCIFRYDNAPHHHGYLTFHTTSTSARTKDQSAILGLRWR